MKKFIVILSVFILFSSVIIVSKSRNQKTEQMLLDFYTQYLSNSIDNEKFRNQLLEKYCSKKMLDTLKTLYSFDEQEGLIVGIDYDVFINSQDTRSIQTLKINKIEDKVYKVYWTDDKDTIIKISIVNENGISKIDSLDSYNLEKIKKEVDSYWNNKQNN